MEKMVTGREGTGGEMNDIGRGLVSYGQKFVFLCVLAYA
jgi:hypothetical protein